MGEVELVREREEGKEEGEEGKDKGRWRERHVR